MPKTSSDLRVPTSCACPHSAYGPLLVDNSDGRCGGQVCMGRGTLQKVVGSSDPDLYTCVCTAPYYQTANLADICSGVCSSPNIIRESPFTPGVFFCLPSTAINSSSARHRPLQSHTKQMHLESTRQRRRQRAPSSTTAAPSAAATVAAPIYQAPGNTGTVFVTYITLTTVFVAVGLGLLARMSYRRMTRPFDS